MKHIKHNIQGKYNIGVIDSGKGGEFISRQIAKVFPDANFYQYKPYTFRPFGTMGTQELKNQMDIHLDYLSGFKLDFIVIGCMTASVRMGTYLMDKIKIPSWDIYLPLVYNLPEACTVVCTPNSVPGFNKHNVIPCTELASMIERNYPDRKLTDSDLLFKIKEYFQGVPFDTSNKPLLLGCTHYYAVADMISQVSQCSEIIYPHTFLNNALVKYYDR